MPSTSICLLLGPLQSRRARAHGIFFPASLGFTSNDAPSDSPADAGQVTTGLHFLNIHFAPRYPSKVCWARSVIQLIMRQVVIHAALAIHGQLDVWHQQGTGFSTGLEWSWPSVWMSGW